MDTNKEFDFQKLLESTRLNHVIQEDEGILSDGEADLDQSAESNQKATQGDLRVLDGHLHLELLLSDAEIAKVVSDALAKAGDNPVTAVVEIMNALVQQFKLTQEQIREITPKIGLAANIHKTVTNVKPEDTRSPERKAQDDIRLGRKKDVREQGGAVREDEDPKASDTGEIHDQLFAIMHEMSDDQVYQFYAKVVLPEMDRDQIIEGIWYGWAELHYNQPEAFKKALQIAQEINAATKSVGGSKAEPEPTYPVPDPATSVGPVLF